jgi:hypothetical protein
LDDTVVYRHRLLKLDDEYYLFFELITSLRLCLFAWHNYDECNLLSLRAGQDAIDIVIASIDHFTGQQQRLPAKHTKENSNE